MAKKKKKQSFKNPNGLSITRKNNTYTFSWQRGQTDYSDQAGTYYWLDSADALKAAKKQKGKQTAVLLVNGHSMKSLTGKSESYSATFPASDFYPNPGKNRLYGVAFHVQAKSKKKKWHELIVHPEEISPPPNVAIGEPTWDSSTSNQVTFNWSAVDTTKDLRPFTYYEWETIRYNSPVQVGADWFKDITWANDPQTYTDYNRGTISSANTTSQIIPDADAQSGAQFTRAFRIRSVGPGGPGAWKYAIKQYGPVDTYSSTPVVESVVPNNSGGVNVNIRWSESKATVKPDSVVVEYLVAVPTYQNGVISPPSATWNQAMQRAFSHGGEVQVQINEAIPYDNCVWVRIKFISGTLDGNVTEPSLAYCPGLKEPTIVPQSPSSTTKMVEIQVTKRSEIANHNIAIYYKTSETNESSSKIIDVVQPSDFGNSDTVTRTIKLPADYDKKAPISFGGSSFVGTYTSKQQADDHYEYTISRYVPSRNWGNNSLFTFESITNWQDGDVPVAPTNIEVSKTGREGCLHVTWEAPWRSSNGAQVLWADHRDAWYSTSQPSSFDVKNISGQMLNIDELSMGVTWYIWVRLLKTASDGTTVYGPLSDEVSFNLTQAPEIPVLELSKTAATIEDVVKASWVYITTDTTLQDSAKIYERTKTGNEYQYTDLQLEIGEEQYADLNIKELGWAQGSTHELVLKVKSKSGIESDYSEAETLTIAPPISVNITTNMSNVTTNEYALTVDTSIVAGKTYYTRSGTDPNYIYTAVSNPRVADLATYYERESITLPTLKAFPLNITFNGATGLSKTVIIKRAIDWDIYRPDESEDVGYAGETVYQNTMEDSYSRQGNVPFIITQDVLDKTGTHFDDNCLYNIYYIVQDGYGQVATNDNSPITFRVSWTHQAIVPEADVNIVDEYITIDGERVRRRYATILPEIPDGYNASDYANDYVDIYRLSGEKPEKIINRGRFGTTYVDPYPTIGDQGGYRVVMVTRNGDYKTVDNVPSWDDYEGYIDTKFQLIDFNGNTVEFKYNVSLDNTWSKNFTVTNYLGGSTQGDWNNSVSRTGSLKGITFYDLEPEVYQDLRDLAEHKGICRLRTIDGTNCTCNIDVSDSSTFNSLKHQHDINLSYTKVDNPMIDGMTLAEWEAGD